jgi:regulator of replication initiation timing
MDAIWIAIVGVLAAPVAAFSTWFLNRKKNYADLYSVLSESSQTAVETMQMTMQELRIELIESRNKIEDLIVENELLRKDLHELKAQNEQLIEENRAFRIKIEELTDTIRDMKN